ncbi:NPCBM/NEW2 domain-containing protein [Nocardioides abyssi]|uniref:NPCBM/NEW2 domain-containing protein n=1 Tax=Nocardioides abyssi TaxID=3058370 RepID=A0ABT8EZ83_9ACTN|nr:NPCBM/NEW2 domain-containing protein [Nocardioides abyssi]MDN4163353.1 NPCBM/NEW2 domain-containing protein [Nocardioides abyssi]
MTLLPKVFLLAALLPAALGVPSSSTAHALDGPPEAPRAAAAAGVSVTLAASSTWVEQHDTVTLRGKVVGARLPARVVIYQKDRGPGSAWHVEARKRTSTSGKFRHTEDIRSGDRKYRACVQGRCSRAVTVRMGTPPQDAEPTAVTIEAASATEVEAGVPFTLSGTASNLDGRRLKVQAYDAGARSWGAIGGAQVSEGQWTATVAVTTAGRGLPLRVVFPGSVGLAPSASERLTVDVYGWYYLYDRTPPQVDEGGEEPDYGSWSVNAVTYAKSMAMAGSPGYTSWGEYDLSKSCRRFEATVGLDDAAESATRSTATIKVDSVEMWTQGGLALGQSHPVSVDLAHGLRLRIEATETTFGRGYVVFGNARVSCAF